MDDEQIERVRKLFERGYTLLLRSMYCISNPGDFNSWRDCYLQVTGFGMDDNEPVAWLEDGSFAGLWGVEPDSWVVSSPIFLTNPSE